MKNLFKLLTLLLVVLVLVQSAVVPSLALSNLEIDVEIYEASTQPSKYSKESNSGQRDVVATTLNGTSAGTYYTGNYTYDKLSTQSASAIKSALTTLMTSTHHTISNYNTVCRDLAYKIDCENNDGRVSLIYTGYSATMSQYNGWNREHVWPQSLGGGNTSGGGADAHHIRPSDAGVNSSRGNKLYGNVSGGTAKTGTNPATGYLGGHYNSTYFEPLDNVKGDVARICLYVHVRWGSGWGASNITDVFQSVDVLLEWCALDPVDTWELGRNEVVQALQGNRNVFIDYPEYAWLIYGKEIPEDMVTPSGKAQANAHEWDNGKVTKDPTCTATGTKTYTCSDCGETKTETIPSLGHNWGTAEETTPATCEAAGKKTQTCSRCSKSQEITILALGHSWNTGIVTTPATCTSTGVKTQTCSRCSDTQESEVAALGHSYSQGFCSSCGQRDPNSKAPTDADFNNAVDKITADLTGKDRFDAISYAVNTYNSLYQTDKDAVAEKYQTLLDIVNDYNNDVNSVNDQANEISESIIGIAVVSSSALLLAAFSLLGKKYF